MGPNVNVDTVINQLDRYERGIQKYLFLRYLQSSNEDLFYAALLQHTEQLLPYLYTPTVGEACQLYCHLPLQPYGLWISANDKGRILHKLKAWPLQNIRVVVVTDGERILGLGDLGVGGMGICEGKSLLYTAAAGVSPHQILPVHVDVGTNNKQLQSDSKYWGLRSKRLLGAPYYDLIDEFVSALKSWQPHVLLQFEDFGNHTAFKLLDKYRSAICCFNDDVQGTACITLAGILCAMSQIGSDLLSCRMLFFGAGEAGTGIGQLIATALHKRYGLTMEEARGRCFFLDSKGLVVSSRTDLQPHKIPFAHDHPFCRDLLTSIRAIRPNVLIGVSTVAKSFTQEVLKAMCEVAAHPVIFPLSNPTAHSECTFKEAMDATDGKVVFASGSPFPPLEFNGKKYIPSQANNAYVFPAIGHAAVLCGAREIMDDVFLIVAEKLASLTGKREQSQGLLFPPFSAIMDVSTKLMAAAAYHMCMEGAGQIPQDFDGVVRQQAGQMVCCDTTRDDVAWELYCRAKMFCGNFSRL